MKNVFGNFCTAFGVMLMIGAMADMRVTLKVLVEVLSADQSKMFDRRIALAQQESLGNS